MEGQKIGARRCFLTRSKCNFSTTFSDLNKLHGGSIFCPPGPSPPHSGHPAAPFDSEASRLSRPVSVIWGVAATVIGLPAASVGAPAA